jgi:hypothetical protein
MSRESSEADIRNEEIAHIVELSDEYLLAKGRYPSKARIGKAIAERAFPPYAREAITPYFIIVLDDSLQDEEIVLDP